MNPQHLGPVVVEITIDLLIYLFVMAASRGVCAALTPPEAA